MRDLSLVLTFMMALPVVATAANFVEVIPAGNSLSTAILVPGGTDRVLGSISQAGEVDLYKFYLAVGGLRTITANSETLDMNLHLFNAAGNPLGANDDISSVNFNSQLTFSLLPGFYFVAVGENNTYALDAIGNRIQDNDPDLLEPEKLGVIDAIGVLAGWDAGGQLTGDYEILFSTAVDEPAQSSVPEPSTVVLAAVGLAAVLFRRR